MLQNISVYCDNMYVIDDLFSTEQFKDKLKSQGSNNFENFLYIVGIDKFSELIWPRRKNPSANKDQLEEQTLKSLPEDSKSYYTEAYNRKEDETIFMELNQLEVYSHASSATGEIIA